MTTPHKNKTIATLLGATLGIVGAHRFYLRGKKDQYGWLHFLSLPLTFLLTTLLFNLPFFVTATPLTTSYLISVLETLMLGLTSDEHWDAKFNQNSGKTSESNWPLALILVFTVGIGGIALIFTLARTFDLLYTGGTYG